MPRDHGKDRELGRWCQTQRSFYTRSKLSSDRVTRLEQLGFVWDPLSAWWEEMFAALAAYKKAHGDFNVPRDHGKDGELGRWCQNQRKLYGASKLSPDRIECLNQVGFVWDPHSAAWEEMFAALIAYKRNQGNCDVPATWKSNPRLARWCSVQRKNYRSRTLSADRFKRLTKIGFDWRPGQKSAEEMFASLGVYKQIYGDCNVPSGGRGNPALGRWCLDLRKAYKNKTLTTDVVNRLEQLGFVWDT